MSLFSLNNISHNVHFHEKICKKAYANQLPQKEKKRKRVPLEKGALERCGRIFYCLKLDQTTRFVTATTNIWYGRMTIQNNYSMTVELLEY